MVAVARPSTFVSNEYGTFSLDEHGRTIWWGTADKPLLGPAHQTAGGVWFVSTSEQMDMLLEELMVPERVYGLDTEFEGVRMTGNADDRETPIGKGRIVCVQFSWADPELGEHPLHPGLYLGRRTFLPNWGTAEGEGWLYRLREWLLSPNHWKTGSFITNTELHLFRNHGMQLDGVRGDSVRMSQQWRNGLVFSHGLKPLGTEVFGYEMREFDQVFSVPRLKKDGQPYANNQRIDVPLREAFSDPTSAIYADGVDYSSLDAKVSLESDFVLREKLDGMKWRVVNDNSLTMLSFYDVDWQPYQFLIAGMEDAGWAIDSDWFTFQRDRAENDLREVEEALNQWAGAKVNWGSPQQKQHLLYGEGEREIAGNIITGKKFPISPMCKQGATLRYDRNKGEEVQKLSTDAIAIQWVRDHIRNKDDKAALDKVLAQTKISKALSAFLRPIPEHADAYGFLHTRLGPEAETGRLSSRSPPLQTLPRPQGDRYQIREGLTAMPETWCPEVARRMQAWRFDWAGLPVPDFEDINAWPEWVDDNQVLIVIDYSQLEMRIMAHYLVMLFNDWALADDLKDGDLHANTAIRVWGSHPLLKDVTAKQIKGHADWRVQDFRNRGKILNFSIAYGKTEHGLAYDIRDENGEPIGVDAARAILHQYFAGYPGLLRYQKWARQYVHANTYVRTLGGRYRYLPQIRSMRKGLQKEAERAAGNTPIQGTAADIVYKAMLKCNTLPLASLRERGYFDEELYDCGARQIMQVHDELVFRGPARYAKQILSRAEYLMQRPFSDEYDGFPAPKGHDRGLPLPVDGKIAATYLGAK